MNYRAVPQVAVTLSYLPLELERLQSLIDAIKKTGEVAPPNCWLENAVNIKNGKPYRYVLLVYQHDRHRKRHSLGKPGSASAREWQARIKRREEIKELSAQIDLLVEFLDRQNKHPISCP